MISLFILGLYPVVQIRIDNTNLEEETRVESMWPYGFRQQTNQLRDASLPSNLHHHLSLTLLEPP